MNRMSGSARNVGQRETHKASSGLLPGRKLSLDLALRTVVHERLAVPTDRSKQLAIRRETDVVDRRVGRVGFDDLAELVRNAGAEHDRAIVGSRRGSERTLRADGDSVDAI